MYLFTVVVSHDLLQTIVNWHYHVSASPLRFHYVLLLLLGHKNLHVLSHSS